MSNANHPDDGMVEAASSFLKIEMGAVIEAMMSKSVRLEACQLFGHVPSRNELAEYFLEKHLGEFRREHPLRIPFVPSMVREGLAA